MKVSIVIPTYNHLENCLRKCVESVRRNSDFSKIPTEVVVVANGCRDGTEDYVRSLGEPYRLLSTPEPLGFVRATNAGAMVATGEYLLFLNDDVQVLDWGAGNGWLRMLMDPLEADPKLGITCTNRDLWSVGRYFAVFFCAMTRRKLFIETGLLDEAFGIGCGEDCDYSMKVQDKGYGILQVPTQHDHWATNFPIWHVGHATFAGVEGKGRENTAILEKRYPRTEVDKATQIRFSLGSMNRGLQ